jgi:hypothetical protein
MKRFLDSLATVLLGIALFGAGAATGFICAIVLQVS